MKKFILFIALVVVTTVGFAQNKTLIFLAEKGEEFSVVYNNVVINEKPASFVKLFGLYEGNCSIGIHFKNNHSSNIYKTINLSQADELTYIIRKEYNNYILTPLHDVPVVRKGLKPGNFIYYSSTGLLNNDPYTNTNPNGNTNPNTPVNTVECDRPSLSDRNFVKAKYEIDSKKSLVLKKEKAQEIISYNCLLASQVSQIIKLIPDTKEQLELAKLSYGHTYDIRNFSVVVNTLTSAVDRQKLNQFINGEVETEPEIVIELPDGSCVTPATEEDFRQGRSAIVRETFDDDRISIAKQFISNHCLNTNQVIELIKLFTFESSKLDFAKYAYNYTYDRKNYYQVQSCFTFSNTKEELNKYISSAK